MSGSSPSSSAYTCHLLGGAFSTFIQFFLGVTCIATLVLKRQTERPQREWWVWYYDVMKQGLGATLGHFMNIALSLFIAAKLAEKGGKGADECQWYCLTYTLDTTLGTCLNIIFLYFVEDIMMKKWNLSIYCPTMILGNYGDPPSYRLFLPQLFIWLWIVVIGKVITFLLVYKFIGSINDLMKNVFRIFENYPELELVVVMVLIPFVLNTLCFWIVDTFLMGKGPAAHHVPLQSMDLDDHSPTGDSSLSLHFKRTSDSRKYQGWYRHTLFRLRELFGLRTRHDSSSNSPTISTSSLTGGEVGQSSAMHSLVQPLSPNTNRTEKRSLFTATATCCSSSTSATAKLRINSNSNSSMDSREHQRLVSNYPLPDDDLNL